MSELVQIPTTAARGPSLSEASIPDLAEPVAAYFLYLIRERVAREDALAIVMAYQDAIVRLAAA